MRSVTLWRAPGMVVGLGAAGAGGDFAQAVGVPADQHEVFAASGEQRDGGPADAAGGSEDPDLPCAYARFVRCHVIAPSVMSHCVVTTDGSR